MMDNFSFRGRDISFTRIFLAAVSAGRNPDDALAYANQATAKLEAAFEARMQATAQKAQRSEAVPGTWVQAVDSFIDPAARVEDGEYLYVMSVDSDRRARFSNGASMDRASYADYLSAPVDMAAEVRGALGLCPESVLSVLYDSDIHGGVPHVIVDVVVESRSVSAERWAMLCDAGLPVGGCCCSHGCTWSRNPQP
jgi:hypothetical protein